MNDFRAKLRPNKRRRHYCDIQMYIQSSAAAIYTRTNAETRAIKSNRNRRANSLARELLIEQEPDFVYVLNRRANNRSRCLSIKKMELSRLAYIEPAARGLW